MPVKRYFLCGAARGRIARALLILRPPCLKKLEWDSRTAMGPETPLAAVSNFYYNPLHDSEKLYFFWNKLVKYPWNKAMHYRNYSATCTSSKMSDLNGAHQLIRRVKLNSDTLQITNAWEIIHLLPATQIILSKSDFLSLSSVIKLFGAEIRMVNNCLTCFLIHYIQHLRSGASDSAAFVTAETMQTWHAKTIHHFSTFKTWSSIVDIAFPHIPRDFCSHMSNKAL